MNATTFTLTNKEIVPLYENLFALDGRSQEVGADAKPRPLVPYKYKKDARLRIGRNIKALAAIYDELLEKKKELRTTLLGSADPIENERKHEQFPQLETEWHGIMQSTSDVQLFQIDYDDLRAEENGIAPSVISALLPILKTE